MSAMPSDEGTKRGDRERCRCHDCSVCPNWTDRIGQACPDCRAGNHKGRPKV